MPFDNTAQDTVERVTPPACTCETCKLARFEGSSIRYAVVHNYSYQPRAWKMNKVANDPLDYFLGVELETDNYKIDRASGAMSRSRFSNQQAADMRRPKMLWMAKRDSSVSGPEFVSHPATLTYWQRNEAKLKDMFQMLVHGGFRSHDNDKAGMHVNISKNAFKDGNHLFRFLTLIHGNAPWALKMSQRTNSSAEQWASLSYLANARKRRDEVERIMPVPPTAAQLAEDALRPYWDRRIGTSSRGSSHRYQALNCPSGQGRFEFRLPRGTLRLDRFMKNLEWAVAMIEYSRTRRVADMKSIPFMRWTVENARLYPNLVRFLSERFDNLIIVAPGITPVAPTVVVDELVEALDSTRVSPRTGLPVRSYNRRAGRRSPGRPVGFSPRNRVPRVAAVGTADLCGVRGMQYNDNTGYYCEYRNGHVGTHGAPGVWTPDFGYSGPMVNAPVNSTFTF